MTWLAWIVLAGVVWVCCQVYSDENGDISCCGCGQCAISGECVMVKKKEKSCRKTKGAYLTNAGKRI